MSLDVLQKVLIHKFLYVAKYFQVFNNNLQGSCIFFILAPETDTLSLVSSTAERSSEKLSLSKLWPPGGLHWFCYCINS